MFEKRLAECADLAQVRLTNSLASFGDTRVADAMRYAASGGKRLRGFLALETSRLYGVPDARSVWAAAAVEAVHAYSLVHDDLPCMDDDDLRRGQPTVHVKWDQATAVLAGDGLQSLAFQLVATPTLQAPTAMVYGLATASSLMVQGQAMDIAAESATTPLSLTEITRLQSAKTGALIVWSSSVGAWLAGEDPAPIAGYGKALGLAFQIADDVLDVEGDVSKTGKKVGKDADAGKATFVSLLGLDGAKARARELVGEAEAALESFGDDGQALREAAQFVISREM